MRGDNCRLEETPSIVDAGLAFAYFADLLETLVICENQEENAK